MKAIVAELSELNLEAPTSMEGVGTYFRACVEWMEGLLRSVRQRQADREQQSDDESPANKRFRKSCRVRDLGLSGFHTKLQDCRAVLGFVHNPQSAGAMNN